MVPEVVSTAYCAWIGVRIKELGEEGFDPLRIARIGGLLHWVAEARVVVSELLGGPTARARLHSGVAVA